MGISLFQIFFGWDQVHYSCSLDELNNLAKSNQLLAEFCKALKVHTEEYSVVVKLVRWYGRRCRTFSLLHSYVGSPEASIQTRGMR